MNALKHLKIRRHMTAIALVSFANIYNYASLFMPTSLLFPIPSVWRYRNNCRQSAGNRVRSNRGRWPAAAIDTRFPKPSASLPAPRNPRVPEFGPRGESRGAGESRPPPYQPSTREEPMRIYAKDEVCGFRFTRAAWVERSNFQPLAVPIAAGPWTFQRQKIFIRPASLGDARTSSSGLPKRRARRTRRPSAARRV